MGFGAKPRNQINNEFLCFTSVRGDSPVISHPIVHAFDVDDWVQSGQLIYFKQKSFIK